LVLAVSFFMPMVDVWGTYSPMRGVQYTLESAEGYWAEGRVDSLVIWGPYCAIIALPHLFGVLALLGAVVGKDRPGATLGTALLIFWFFPFALMLGGAFADEGFEVVGTRVFAHYMLAMGVILVGVPWIRRPLPRWTERRLHRRATRVAALVALAWFTSWITELDDLHYGLWVAIVACVAIVVGTHDPTEDSE